MSSRPGKSEPMSDPSSARVLLESAQEFLFLLDRDFQILDLNSAAADALASTRAKALGRVFTSFFSDGFAREVLAPSLESCLAGRLLRREVNIHWPGVGEKWGDLRFAASALKTGQPADAAIISFVDRTREHRISHSLEEGRETFRTIFNAVYDVIFLHHTDGSIIDVNERVLDVYGVSREEALELNILEDFSAAGNLLDGKEEVWSKVAAGHMQFFEWKARRPKSGEEFDVEVFLRSIELSGEKVILTNVRDVSQQKAIQRALQRSEAKYRVLYEQASEGILVADQELRLVDANPKALEILGRSLEDTVGLNYMDLVALEDLEAVPLRLKSVLAGEVVRIERTMLRKDGNRINVAVSAKLIEDERVLFVISDITDQKRMEQELLSAKMAAEEANESKSKFLATVTHEIRTAISGVEGMTQLLRETDLDEDQSKYVRLIRDAMSSMLSLVNDILDFSKLEARKLELHEEDFELKRNLDDQAESYKIQAGNKGLKFELELDPDIPAWAHGDANRLNQVLRNLLNNALKFTEEGVIRLSVALRKETDRQLDLVFAVSDSGCGIPDDKVHRLFKSYSQADASVASRYGGTGLGLAISKQLVEMMGGVIWLESRVNVGTTFFFTVRLAPARTEGENLVYEYKCLTDSKTGSGVKLLLAEDNSLNRTYLSHALGKAGHFVQAVPDGHAAIKALSEEEFDLALLDGRMPVVDGIAVARWLRQEEHRTGRARTPAIALTAQAMTGDAERFLEAGMDAVLTKPVDFNRLLCLILDLTEGKVRVERPANPSAGKGSVRRLLAREFAEEAPDRLAGLESALARGRLDDLADQAHSLANSAIAVGEEELLELARKLEKAAREDGPDACGRVMGELRPCMERSLEHLAPLAKAKE